VGATKPSHIEDAVASLDIELTDDEVTALEAPYNRATKPSHIEDAVASLDIELTDDEVTALEAPYNRATTSRASPTTLTWPARPRELASSPPTPDPPRPTDLTPTVMIVPFACSGTIPLTFWFFSSRVDWIVPRQTGRLCHQSRLSALLVQPQTRMFPSGGFHVNTQFTHHDPIQRHKYC